MFKNVATKIALLFVDSNGVPKTGDAANLTAYVSKDHGSVAALADTSATEISSTNAPGWYLFDVAQAETNADALLFTGKSTTSGVVCVAQMIFTRPNLFTSLAIDSYGGIKVNAPFRKNVAVPKFIFPMTDSSNHNPQAGLGSNITVSISKDGGAFAGATTPAVTEISGGDYWVALAAADMNADAVTVRCTGNAGGSDVFKITLYPNPAA